MYGVVRPLIPPLGATDAVVGEFINRGSRCLVLVKRTHVETYVLVGQGEADEEAKLQMISDIPLYGVIRSCAVLRMPGCEAESLVLGFDGLRCATLSWDRGVHGWKTDHILPLQSLMRADNVDDEDVTTSTLAAAPGLMRGRAAGEDHAVVRADPNGRCFVALARAASKLFVVPIAVSRRRAPSLTPESVLDPNSIFWLDFEEYGIRNVAELVFLHGYFEPTILVVFEPVRSWAGRVAINATTTTVAAFSFNITGRRHHQMWKIADLPYDTFNALAVPENAGGGALLVSGSTVLYVSHGQVLCGLSFNSFGDELMRRAHFGPAVAPSTITASLETARCCFLDSMEPSLPQNTAVFGLKGGELYFLTLLLSGSTNSLRVTRAGSSVVASRVVPMAPGFFVLASRISDTILVQYERRVEEVKSKPAAIGDDYDVEMRDTFALDEEEESQQSCQESWVLKVWDTLLSMGPGADIAVGLRSQIEQEEYQNSEDGVTADGELELVIAGGHGRHGGVSILERSVRPIYPNRFPLEGCRRAWTLRDPRAVASAKRSRTRTNASITSRNARTAERNAQILAAREEWIQAQKAEHERQLREEVANRDGSDDASEDGDEKPAELSVEDSQDLNETFVKIEQAAQEQELLETPEDEDDLHLYALLSSDDSTIVLETSTEISKLSDTDFREDSPTLAAGNALGNRVIVQVHKEGARLLQGRRMILDHSLPYDALIEEAHVMDPYVMLRLSNGLVVLLLVETSEEEEDAAAAVYAGTVGIGESLMDEYGGGMDDELEDGEQITIDATLRQVFETDLVKHGFCTAATLYSGPMAKARFHAPEPTPDQAMSTTMVNADRATDEVEATVGNEEYMLYGEQESESVESEDAERSRRGMQDCPWQDNTGGEPGFLLLTVTLDGGLEIFDVNGLEAIFRTGRFYLGPKILSDEGGKAGGPGSAAATKVQEEQGKDAGASRIVGVQMTCLKGLSDDIRLPVLVGILPHGGLLFYTAFLAPSDWSAGGHRGRSRLRFRKLVADDLYTQGEKPPSVHVFRNVAHREGIFVAGRRSFFLFADRGYPRMHPLGLKKIRSDLLWFAEFHNLNCPHGFITLDRDGTVSIGALPPPGATSYDNPWPMRRVPLRCSVHHIAYHAVTATFGLLVSTLIPRSREEVRKAIKQYSSQVQVEKEKSEAQGVAMDGAEEDGTEASALAGDDPQKFAERLPTLFEEKHELHLHRPDTWELVKKHTLKDFEVGLAIKSMVIDVYKMAKTGTDGNPSSAQQQRGDPTPSLFAATVKLRPKNMLVVGTGYLRGEDASTRGRLLMFEVSKQERFTEDGKISTFQMQLIAEKELKGQVSAVESLQGYVVVGVGPKVEVYKLVEDEIVCCSFFFAQLFCTSISTLKQFILVGDMFKSVSFIYWRDRNKSLNFLGKDYEPSETYATEFLLHEDELSLLCSDSIGNIQLFNYENASVAESRGGTQLLANGGFHVGSRINRFIRVRAEFEGSEHPAKEGNENGAHSIDAPAKTTPNLNSNGAGRHAVMYATLDCGLGAVVPVDEAAFKRLANLQSKLYVCADLPFYAGLTPREFRTFHPQTKSHHLLNRRLLDGQLLMEYKLLDAVRKKELARQIGVTVREVIETLESLDNALLRF